MSIQLSRARDLVLSNSPTDAQHVREEEVNTGSSRGARSPWLTPVPLSTTEHPVFKPERLRFKPSLNTLSTPAAHVQVIMSH